MTDLYPLLLEPSLHVKVWGGRRLQTTMHKTLPTDEPYGESWELHDTSTVANGAFAGRTLADLLDLHGTALIGAENDPAEGFPLLAKLLDANDWLSVQVHPDDAQAKELEGQPRGKTEAWVILSAEPGAQLVIGVEPGTDREAMATAIKTNTLEDLLVYADVQVGDVLYIPAGTVHAIGPGIVLYEIQQSSNTTYRLYDWGRMGLDGKPRELHIDKGVKVSNVAELPQIQRFAGDESPEMRLVEGAFFTTALHRLHTDTPININKHDDRFDALTCIEGSLAINGAGISVTCDTGRTVLIPASVQSYTMQGAAQVLRSWQR